MVVCAYCEKPLICDGCGVDYVPPTEDHYRALSQPDSRITCTQCGETLICHWCKTPYGGVEEDGAGAPGSPAF